MHDGCRVVGLQLAPLELDQQKDCDNLHLTGFVDPLASAGAPPALPGRQ